MVNRLVFVKFKNKEERIFQRIEKHEKMSARKFCLMLCNSIF